MFEVAWREFNSNDRLVVKRRAFKTQKQMEAFIERLFERDNFYELYGTREG